MKILDLDLPDRVKRCLIRSRIETLEQLLELSCDDLLKVRNLGKKSYTELMAFLEYNGLQMKDGIRYIGNVDDYRKRLLEEMKGKPVISPSYDGHDEEEVTIVLPKWAIAEMNDLINGEYGKNRGFKMTYSDLIQEMIANFKEWSKKRKTPVLGASLNENEEIPDPYEISQENEVLWRRVAWLEDKLRNKEKILFALKQYAKIGFDQITWKNIVLLRVEEGEKDYETIKEWLDEN